jgi:hypothetical protein
MIRQSESIASLAAALVGAQAEMPNVPKSTKGQVGNAVRFYADLATVVETVQPILAKHGLAYVQMPANDGATGTVTVTTRLIHKSGEWLEDALAMPTGNGGAQQVGSAITYARRYSLMAVLGLAPEDDDGHAAQVAHRAPQPARQQSRPAPVAEYGDPEPLADLISDAQMKKLIVEMNEAGVVERDARLALCVSVVGRPLGSSKELTKAEARMLIDYLVKSREAA